ncbi:MAG: hypothetical protein JXB32_17935 [Deltaproteobacteria bacterium]|nr:hypothetical protein [Deltaproteobacteria bacterium]
MPQIRHEDQKKQPTFALPKAPAPAPAYPVRGGPLSKLGALTEYAWVRAFQITFNAIWVNSQVLPAGRRITGTRIKVDGKYASETQGALERLVTWLVREGECTGTSRAEARSNGPNGVAGCLRAIGTSDAQIAEMQTAWREWKGLADVPAAGGGSGDGTTPPSDGGGDGGGSGGGIPTPRRTAKKAGWFGGLLIGLDALVGSVLAASSKRWK